MLRKWFLAPSHPFAIERNINISTSLHLSSCFASIGLRHFAISKKEVKRRNKKQKSTRKEKSINVEKWKLKQEGEFPRFTYVNPVEAAKKLASRRVVDLDSATSLDPSPAKRPLKPHEARQIIKSQENQQKNSPTYSGLLTAKEVMNLPSKNISGLQVEQLNVSDEKSYFDFKKSSTLSSTKKTEQEYYDTFLIDRDRRQDAYINDIKTRVEDYSNQLRTMRDDGSNKRKKYVSPREYWYQNDYTSPTPSAAAQLCSRDLRFAMMNEAHKFRQGQRLDDLLWTAFEERCNEIKEQVKTRTLIRLLQPIASVQRPYSTPIRDLMHHLWLRHKELRGKDCIFLLQAMTRLRIRDTRSIRLFRDLTLVWPTLRTTLLIRAINSLSKLDFINDVTALPLRSAFAARIPSLTPRQIRRIKFATLIKAMDDDALMKFLEHAKEVGAESLLWYSRPLVICELYLRLRRPDFYSQLSPSLRIFMEHLRHHWENISKRSVTGPDMESDDEEQEQRGRRRSRNRQMDQGKGQPGAISGMFGESSSRRKLGRPEQKKIEIEEKEESMMIANSSFDNNDSINTEVSMGGRLLAEYSGDIKRAVSESRSRKMISDSAEEHAIPISSLPTLSLDQGPSSLHSSSNDRERHKELRERISQRDGVSLFNKKKHSSLLSSDVSRVLSLLDVSHDTKLIAGPYIVDIQVKHPSQPFIIECNIPTQYYSNVKQFTSNTQIRHALLFLMGFRIVHVPYYVWNELPDDNAKKMYLEHNILKSNTE